jgi:hypothetical protein
MAKDHYSWEYLLWRRWKLKFINWTRKSSTHDEFELWYATRRYKENCLWHPELNRYTVLTDKQNLWECWNAARGIKYVYITGYPTA